jgi:hypothetical protein
MASANPPCGPPQPRSPRRGGPQGWPAAMSSASRPRAFASYARRSSDGLLGQQSLGCDLRAREVLHHKYGGLRRGRREADQAAKCLPGDCVLAHSDHEWHRHDSELLRADPDHDATMEVLHPFRNPALAPAQADMWRRPAAVTLPHRALADCAPLITALSADAAGNRRSGGRSNCYSVAASSSCGVRMFRYAGISAIAPKVAPRLRDDARTGSARQRRDEA